MIMKKVIRLTETDLVRIVNKVIKESGFRVKFEGADYWIDEYGNYVDFDPDLDSVGYYDFEYEPVVDVEVRRTCRTCTRLKRCGTSWERIRTTP